MPRTVLLVPPRITAAGARIVCPRGLAMAAFEYRQAEEVRAAFQQHGEENGAALVAALRELGFAMTDAQASEIVRGKDFVQLKNGPFDLDLVFAPDGLETFEYAFARRVDVDGFPVCHIDDIIASKEAANRAKDRESLPRLRAFRDYWKMKHPGT